MAFLLFISSHLIFILPPISECMTTTIAATIRTAILAQGFGFHDGRWRRGKWGSRNRWDNRTSTWPADGVDPGTAPTGLVPGTDAIREDDCSHPGSASNSRPCWASCVEASQRLRQHLPWSEYHDSRPNRRVRVYILWTRPGGNPVRWISTTSRQNLHYRRRRSAGCQGQDWWTEVIFSSTGVLRD